MTKDELLRIVENELKENINLSINERKFLLKYHGDILKNENIKDINIKELLKLFTAYHESFIGKKDTKFTHERLKKECEIINKILMSIDRNDYSDKDDIIKEVDELFFESGYDLTHTSSIAKVIKNKELKRIKKD